MSDLTAYTHHIERILKVIVYIDTHLDKELSLEKMAKLACISPYYFHRLFRVYIGETLAEYVKRLRLQRAEGHLRYSDTAITDIALDLGYESPSAFTKVFNQVMGTSPSQYRKTMQPLLQAIIKRTIPNEGKAMLKPEYVDFKEETVLFVRRIGDYNDTPNSAFQALGKFLQDEGVPEEKIKTYYSMALDDPQIVERSKCRFDACVAFKNGGISAKGEVGQKILQEGRYAVFIHVGPTKKLESAFYEIFRLWYPTSQKELADAPDFCEHINAFDNSIPDSERITKIYIPIKS